MSFTWSAATNDENGQSPEQSGKRTKTSHPNEVKSGYESAPLYTEGKQGSHAFSSEVKTLTYHDMSHSFPGNTTISNWDIDGGLAADFDGSLSGLGAELGSTTYNMR